MKVLMYVFYTPSPLFETELELLKKHEDAGDEILVLQCRGDAPVCHWNKTRSPLFCTYCKSRFIKGIQILNPGKNVQIQELRIPKIIKELPSPKITIEELKQWTWKGSQLGLGIASSLITKNFRDHRLDVSKMPMQLCKESQLAVGLYESLEKAIQLFKPELLIFFNGRISSATPAIYLCRKYAIPFQTYEVGGNQGRFLLRNNSTPHSIAETKKEISSLWTKGDKNKTQTAHEWFRERRNGVDQGIISFTKDQKAGKLPLDFDKNKRNIVIFNSTIEEYAAIEGWENPLYKPDETAGVRNILESFKNNSDFHFYLRVHPHMKHTPIKKNSQLQDIKKLEEVYSNLTVIWPKEIIHSYALVDACEKTVTFGSTIGVEAAYWQKPSILLGRSFYEDFKCIYVPKTHDETVTLLLQKNLPALPADDALEYGYREKSYGEPFTYVRQIGTEKALFLEREINASVPARTAYYIWRFFQKIKKLITIIITRI